MADAKTISNAIQEIKAAYPRFVVEADTIKVWAVYLSDLPNDLLMAAIRKFISSSSHAFPPSIPEIRQVATQVKAEIVDMPSSYEAWDDLLRAGNGWHYETGENPDGSAWMEKTPYKFRHPLVETVARRFGWPDRFPSGDDDMADRAHFFKAYESAMNKTMRAETQLPSVTAYIEGEKNLLDAEVQADRRAALDTGEQAYLMRQLTARMSK
jgi:loader and inhibitor of G40P protein